MLTHFWHNSEINQTQSSIQISKYTIPAGYVNATQMARANRKLLSDYMRLKTTKEYLQELANDMGIPISSLIIEISGYGKEQGTWVHPEVAIDIARWVSVPFRVWANRTLVKVMLTQEVDLHPSSVVSKTIAPSQEAAQLALMLGEFAGLDKSLTAQLAINAAAAVNPALSPAVDGLKTAIAITNATDDAYLNPTQIGEVVGMSNQFAIRNSQFAIKISET
ncbi:KilA-N domain-containing protein [Nostoc sp. CENA67]|uniref:KilA-N domain-containing protein n=1 Tax=Amazonocrinis nigriterrae CENA67 TaxID=2794033 RepID=A0A8J7HWN2_9NOST|nr:KilA-N domain-containing protein [Amazonocrinis nigriterrae]MBH8564963.1 KilA-N domain-containing protein [Amazonocrinis nigriterrae CENA67]